MIHKFIEIHIHQNKTSSKTRMKLNIGKWELISLCNPWHTNKYYIYTILIDVLSNTVTITCMIVMFYNPKMGKSF